MSLYNNLTINDLNIMDFKKFEKIAINILKLFFKEKEISLFKTKDTKDGGKDGEAHIIIGGDLPQELQQIVKYWVEVKWRKPRGKKIDRYDVGGHLIKASNEGIAKLIFITNWKFAEALKKDISEFGKRVCLNCSLIDGERLIELISMKNLEPQLILNNFENKNLVQKKTKGIQLDIKGQFATDPYNFSLFSIDEEIRIQYYEPSYIIFDVEVTNSILIADLKFELIPKNKKIINIFPLKIIKPEIYYLGDKFRIVFSIWAMPDSEITYDDLKLNVTTKNKKISVNISSMGCIKVGKKYLSEFNIDNNFSIYKKIETEISNWNNDCLYRFILIKAGPGNGKTFTLCKLRKIMHINNIKEITFDGEIHNTDLLILKRTFETIFPLPLKFLSIEMWLIDNGMNKIAASKLSSILCSQNDNLDFSEIPPSTLSEFLAALLIYNSKKTTLVFIYEDLHKIHASGLTLLIELNKLLSFLNKGRIMILTTSRLFSENNRDKSFKYTWAEELRSLEIHEKVQVYKMEKLKIEDATNILINTIPSLNDYHCKKIIDQIGVIPFNLKEAILFFEQKKLISKTDDGVFFITNNNAFFDLIKTKNLIDSTSRRIHLFIYDNKDILPWIDKFLYTGACIGNSFNYVYILKVLGIYDNDIIKLLIKILYEWDILLSRGIPSCLSFNHDLIRSMILKNLSEDELTEYSQIAYKAIVKSHNLLLLVKLSFLAGYNEKCLKYANQLTSLSKKFYNYKDAIEANYISLSLINPIVGSELLNFKGDNELKILDEAILIKKSTGNILKSTPSERWKNSLNYILKSLDLMTRISGGSSEYVNRLIIEGYQLVKNLNILNEKAQLLSFEGRMHFEQDEFTLAEFKHLESEKIYSITEDSIYKKERLDNLSRLFLCYRQSDRFDDSIKILRLLFKQRPINDYEFLAKLISYYGYLFFYYDLKKAIRLWEMAANITKCKKIFDRYPHHLIGVGYSSILLENYNYAEKCLKESEKILEENNALEITNVRLFLNLGVLYMVKNEFGESLSYFYMAEQTGLHYNLGRRLWRIEANMANLFEIYNEYDKLISYDARCINSIANRFKKEEINEYNNYWLRQRTVLPLINCLLRENDTKFYKNLIIKNFNNQIFNTVLSYTKLIKSGNYDKLPSILRFHLKKIANRYRMIITE